MHDPSVDLELRILIEHLAEQPGREVEGCEDRPLSPELLSSFERLVNNELNAEEIEYLCEEIADNPAAIERLAELLDS